jgi:hypothetical protein
MPAAAEAPAGVSLYDVSVALHVTAAVAGFGPTFAYGAIVLAGALTVAGSLSTLEWILLGLLLAVLAADGLVNVLPAGFRTFKDSVQEAWVRRRGAGTEAASDERLFLAGNLALGIAAATMAAVVILYEPIAPELVAASALLALALSRRSSGGSFAEVREAAVAVGRDELLVAADRLAVDDDLGERHHPGHTHELRTPFGVLGEVLLLVGDVALGEQGLGDAAVAAGFSRVDGDLAHMTSESIVLFPDR